MPVTCLHFGTAEKLSEDGKVLFEVCTQCGKALKELRRIDGVFSPWPERRPPRTEGERAKFAEAMSAHLPKPDAFKVVHFSEDDLKAVKAAFMKRFDEQLPRTETMMCVAAIGYRMALRDMAASLRHSQQHRRSHERNQ